MTPRICSPVEALAPVLAAGNLLVCLEFDGTRAPAGERRAVALPAGVTEALSTLAAAPGITVAVISGSSITDLRHQFGSNIICLGCQGLQIEGPGLHFIPEPAQQLAPIVDQAAWDLEAAVLHVPGVFVERKGLCAALHHRQAPPHLVGWLRSTVEWILAPYRGLLRTSEANSAWEIRPCVEWNQASALRYLVEHLGPPAPFVLYAGDDLANEEMFAAINHGISISVGARQTVHTTHRVANLTQFGDLLQALCAALHPLQCAASGGLKSPAQKADRRFAHNLLTDAG